jgi:hypothetical protein
MWTPHLQERHRMTKYLDDNDHSSFHFDYLVDIMMTNRKAARKIFQVRLERLQGASITIEGTVPLDQKECAACVALKK